MKRAELLDARYEDGASLIGVDGVNPSSRTFLDFDRLTAATGSISFGGGCLERLRSCDVALLALAAEGLNDKGIARNIGWHASAVHQRWRVIRDILGAKDRAHAVAIGLSLQLIGPPQRALEMLAEN